jgi:DNA-binding PadR family transcriptional regulator
MQSPLSARAALLQVLDYPAHGLELIRRVHKRTGGAVSLNQGSVYPALRQLEREHLVRGWTGRPAKGGGRPRRYYERGRKESGRLRPSSRWSRAW